LNQPAGESTVTAIGVTSGKSATTGLTVTALVAAVSVAHATGGAIKANEDIKITVTGFPSNADMTYHLDSIKITVTGASTKTDGNGDLEVTYKLPVSTAGGTHSLTASGGGCSKTVTFESEAQSSYIKLTIDGQAATEGRAGQTLKVSGENYIDTGSSTVTLTFGDIQIPGAKDLDLTSGSFSVNYTLPEKADVPDGIYIVKAVTSESEEATASFRLDNTAPAVPTVSTASTARSVTVSWTEAQETDASSYHVYRKGKGTDDWTEIASYSTGYTISYTDTLTPKTDREKTFVYGVTVTD